VKEQDFSELNKKMDEIKEAQELWDKHGLQADSEKVKESIEAQAEKRKQKKKAMARKKQSKKRAEQERKLSEQSDFAKQIE